ncbi:SurA N-terminal domain-containing protein, partial [Novosphingobium sp. UBA1939]
MLGFFRSFLKSRLGVILALVFLALIALAFAGADITGSRFGGVAGGDRAASVGGDRIGIGDLGKTVTRAFESERQQTPTLTMKDFLEQGALDDALSGMVDRTAMLEWGKKYG